MGCRLRNTLPSAPGHLQPETISRDAVVSRDIQSKTDQASTYNRHRGVRTLPQLLPGDYVLVWNADQKQWRTPGQVKRQMNGRSYQVVLPGGSVIRRNRHQLKFHRHSTLIRQWNRWPADVDTTFQDEERLPENAVAGGEDVANPRVQVRQPQVQCPRRLRNVDEKYALRPGERLCFVTVF